MLMYVRATHTIKSVRVLGCLRLFQVRSLMALAVWTILQVKGYRRFSDPFDGNVFRAAKWELLLMYNVHALLLLFLFLPFSLSFPPSPILLNCRFNLVVKLRAISSLEATSLCTDWLRCNQHFRHKGWDSRLLRLSAEYKRISASFNACFHL